MSRVGSIPSATQFLNATLAKERPIFGRRQVQHLPPHPVTHLVAANRCIVLVLANKSIQRVDQNLSDGAPEAIDLGKTIGAKCKPYGAFLDPTGTHLVISLKPTSEDTLPDLVYLSRRSIKAKMSSKIRGHLITAIAWNPLNRSESVSGVVLLGTTLGLVFESEFDSGEDRMFSTNLERQWKQVLDVGKGRHVPITGLEFYPVGRSSSEYYALVATSNRLYQFVGAVGDCNEKLSLVNVFKNAEAQPFRESTSALKFSLLSCCYKSKEVGKLAAFTPLTPKKFGWMTDEGITSGTIEEQKDSKKSVVRETRLTVLPNIRSENLETVPKSMVLTEFHALLAYSNRIVGICLLNDSVAFDDELDLSYGQIRGISRDVVAGTLYAFSDYAIYEYTVEREERNVWRVYLQQGDFEAATRYCLGDEEKMEQVMLRQAEDFHAKERYVESAICFAKTKCSLEKVVLKFMQMDDKTALLTYLKKRLEVVKSSETAQLTMLVVWLFEIYLNMIGNKSSKEMKHGGGDEVEIVEDAFTDQTSREMLSMLKFSKVRDCVASNKTTFYELLGSHGDKKNMIRFGHELQDYDRVIHLHLQDNEFVSALRVLETQRKPELYYQYGPLLMPEIPNKFVSSVIQQGKRLKPSRMIPSLVVSSKGEQELEAIRYLEFAIQSLESKEAVIHNFLLSLYVKHQQQKVMMYLNERCSNPQDIFFDVNYALRLCTEQGLLLRKACVQLHCILGQLDQAVELALEDGDLEQAKSCLEFARDEDKAKRIWLRIARYVVQDKNDIKQAMNFLQQCDGLVKIENILPFFPDFVTIDDFKDAICDSLQDYSKHIQELKEEMEEAYDAAKEIRSDIQKFKGRHVFVKASDVCSLCDSFLLTKPFHLFICSHRFHTQCLTEAVLPHLSVARQRKVKELRHELANNLETVSSKQSNGDSASVDSKQTGFKLSRKDQARAELDDLIAHECIFCGEVMIKLIDKPFIDDDKFDELLNEWL